MPVRSLKRWNIAVDDSAARRELRRRSRGAAQTCSVKFGHLETAKFHGRSGRMKSEVRRRGWIVCFRACSTIIAIQEAAAINP